MRSLGDRIRQLRIGLGMSQSDLASVVDVSPSAIAHWELGYCNVAPQHHEVLADALGVRVECLKDGTETVKSSKAATSTQSDNSDRASDTVKLFKLPPKIKKAKKPRKKKMSLGDIYSLLSKRNKGIIHDIANALLKQQMLEMSTDSLQKDD